MLVKSLVSIYSSTPFMLLSPARIMNWPVGDQNRWLAVFLSYFFRRTGFSPGYKPILVNRRFPFTILMVRSVW